MEFYLSHLAVFTLSDKHYSNMHKFNYLNYLMDRSEGLKWRLKEDVIHSLKPSFFPKPNAFAQLSIWKDTIGLNSYYTSNQYLSFLNAYGLKLSHEHVIWWSAESEIPTLSIAQKKLNLLYNEGPTIDAFTIDKLFPNPKKLIW